MKTKGLIAASVLALGFAMPTHQASAGWQPNRCMELGSPTEYVVKCPTVTTEVVVVDIADALVVERTAAEPIMAMPKFMG